MPEPETFTVRQPAYGGVTRWPAGSWDAHIGKLGWLPPNAPWPLGRCTAVSYADDLTFVDLTYIEAS